MKHVFSTIISTLAIGCLFSQATFSSPTNEQLDSRIKALEKRTPKPSNNTEIFDTLSIHGTFRPTLVVHDNGNDTSYDVGDALSRIGFKGSLPITDGLEAIFEGEWSIDISDNGDFGKSRKAYVGLKSNYGTIAIGKQRTPHYLLIAEPVDIFNHANSPFAYDNVGTFFANNQISYRYYFDHFQFLGAIQTNGSEGDDKADIVNFGASYTIHDWYIATAYLSQTIPFTADALEEGNELTNIAVTTSYSFNSFYIAAAYQKLENDTDANDIDGHTIDISGSMKFANNKIKIGIFEYDDGLKSVSKEHRGWNITFEKQLNPQFRAHIEYLYKDFEIPEADNQNTIAIGFRYDFERNMN